MQSFPSAIQKQIDLFRNKTQHIRNRLKACLFILDDSDKIKPEMKERIKGVVKSYYSIIIDICMDVLEFYNNHISRTVTLPKFKQEIKLPLEVDETLRLFQYIFVAYPELEVKDIDQDGLYKVLANMLKTEVPIKYKKYGFFILINYLRLANKNKIAISSVSI